MSYDLSKTCLRNRKSAAIKCDKCSSDCPLYLSTALGKDVLLGVDLDKLAREMELKDKAKKFVMFIK